MLPSFTSMGRGEEPRPRWEGASPVGSGEECASKYCIAFAAVIQSKYWRDHMGLFDLLKKQNARPGKSIAMKKGYNIAEHEDSIAADGTYDRQCKSCKTRLHAFRYYRDNLCDTYCEKCGNPSDACYAAPYKTIELLFSGIQREGYNLTIGIADYPSFKKADLCAYEWNSSGGIITRVHLPADYIPEHTVTEFIHDYLLSPNEVTDRCSLKDNSSVLNDMKKALIDSDLFLIEKP